MKVVTLTELHKVLCDDGSLDALRYDAITEDYAEQVTVAGASVKLQASVDNMLMFAANCMKILHEEHPDNVV